MLCLGINPITLQRQQKKTQRAYDQDQLTENKINKFLSWRSLLRKIKRIGAPLVVRTPSLSVLSGLEEIYSRTTLVIAFILNEFLAS